MPVFDTSHLLFVTLFGVVVTIWGVVRVLRPTPFLIAVDNVGRAAFATWFVWPCSRVTPVRTVDDPLGASA